MWPRHVLRWGREGRMTATFAETLDKLHADQHTGPVTIHFQHGMPKSVEIPSEPTRIRLDTPPKPAKLDMRL
jgi:hypothetical protein